MGWNSANEIFDPVAQALLNNNVDHHSKVDILTTLIRNLQSQDWDTEDESLDDFRHEDSVVEAFRLCGVPGHDSYDEDWTPNTDHRLEIPIKRLLTYNNPVPVYAKDGDAGVDLRSTVQFSLYPGERQLIPTGIAVAIPKGYVGLVHPRSGLANDYGISIVNAPGTIDSGYRGEIKVNLINLGEESVCIMSGERIAQLVFQRVEEVKFLEVYDLPDSERGSTGHGSSGR